VSVINKMLRDLDSRNAAEVRPASGPQSSVGLSRDTLLVDDLVPARRGVGLPIWTLVMAVTVVLAATAAAWWYGNNSFSPPSRVNQASPAPIAVPVIPVPVTPLPAIPAVAVASASASIPLPVMGANVAVPAPRSSSPQGPASAVALVGGAGPMPVLPNLQKSAEPKPLATPRPPAEALPMDRPPATQPVKAAKPVKAVKAVKPVKLVEAVKPTAEPIAKPLAKPSVPVASKPPNAMRQSAAQETLAQAQSLWRSGSHQAATDFLTEALTVAERSNAAGGQAGNNSVLTVLVRELASMKLAEGQVSEVLALLIRLEPRLSGVADIWAIRGNAAQRLGRHAESVAAYQMALKLRPDEPRWMLGAAVSLAAQGQTSAAAQLAIKARDGGALPPEVANYLRQLGVLLPEH